MLSDGTAGSSTTTSESPSTLADEIGALWDGGFGGSESPDDETTDAGAPPAESAPTLETAQASSEGEPAAEHAGAPPASSTSAASNTPDQGVPPTDDPLAGAETATYTVDGQARTFEGLTKLGDKGAIVSPDAYPKLLQRLSERDHLFERQQEQYRKYAALETQFNALTQWSLGRDQQGQDRTISGADALETQRALLARSLATNQIFAAALDDPSQFERLVSVVDDGQGNLRIVPDQHAIQTLRVMAENASIKAEQQARSYFAQLRARLTSTGSQPERPTTTQPHGGVSPALEPSVAMQSVENAMQQADVPQLSDDSKAFLAQQIGRYIRPTTAEERAQYGPTVTQIVDASFATLVKREAHAYTQQQTLAKSATTAAQAAEENARRLAAAAAGVRKPASAPAVRSAPQAPATPKETDQQRAWRLREALASGRLGSATEL